MPLLAPTLASELEAMVPVGTEVEAINNFVGAWEGYFANASVAGVPTMAGSLTAAATAMRGALVGMSSAGAGATALQAGITAFWGAVVGSAATIWVLAPPVTSATPPPGLGGMGVALEAAFLANINGGLSLTASVTNIANVLHPLQIGGIAVQTGAPPVNIPIL